VSTLQRAEPLQDLLSKPLVWTALALIGSVMLHIDRTPLWGSAIALGLIAWRIIASMRPIRLPGKIPRVVLAFVLVGTVFVRFHTLNGLAAGILLLTLMSAVKLLETHAPRDQYIVVGGSLFLLIAACLERQNLSRTPLYLLQAWACCGTLAIIAYSPKKTVTSAPSGSATPGGFGYQAALLLAGRALLYSLPLALVLFVLFPRVQGAFWAIPSSEDAETGLSDTMSPGSISQLTSSYEIAFRAKFTGTPPPAHERYWRGPVLHHFDGYTWSRREESAYLPEHLEYLGPAYRYHIVLEPSQQRWWFSLDTVDTAPDHKASLAYDYELIARDPVTEPTSYDAVSHTATRSPEPLSKLARQVEIRLPPNRNPRSVQFAREMRRRAASDGAFVGEVLEFLRTGGFVYSLTPPLLDYDSVDDFLFRTRSGFCGHYASAFVMLMRAAGVPARVVTGYLGGEWNPIGGYFIIRQSDAHSWAEVWLEGRGWTRVDPTTVVEPDRLTRGMLDLLPAAGSTEARLVRSSPTLTRLLHRWDAVNAWWNDQVLKFDYHSQIKLLSWLGIHAPGPATLGWAFVATLLLWLGWIARQIGRAPPRRRADRLARAYERLCSKLGKAGLPREAYQGPLAYADTVGERRPELADRVGALLVKYAQLRYGAAPPSAEVYAAELQGFERAVANLSLKPT
jgi:transglutaminase-like putative cysteine protease